MTNGDTRLDPDMSRHVGIQPCVAIGTDKSYGIQVARLAGLPPTVIERAREVLTQLEGSAAAPAKVSKTERVQLTLFEAEEPPALKELRATDVDTLSPLEALNLLHRWKGEIRG